jgi:hypothetical protein
VVALVQPDQLRDVARLHASANVTPVVDTVHPGHPAVRELATSGTPIIVRPRASAPAGGTGRPRQQRRGGPRRSSGARPIS